MTPNARFSEFLTDINPSTTTTQRSQSAHTEVRKALLADETFKSRVERTFLGGSYKRQSAIRPVRKGDDEQRPDVDIYVVVDASPDWNTPADLMEELFAALDGNRKELGITKLKRGRCSIAVSMNKADLDVSVLLERQTDGYYRIGNKDTGEWYPTDPEEHTNWSTRENTRLSGRLKPMTKMLKWARRENPTQFRHPKSFALEALLAANMSENVGHYGQLFHDFCDAFVNAYQADRDWGSCPELADPAIQNGNILAGVSADQFCAFFDKIKAHRDDAARALSETDQEKATKYWRRIFGTRFPSPKSDTASSLKTASAMSPLTFGAAQALPSRGPAKFA